ncbi:DUF1330 domain-containing protein [Nonomuraea antimicrobica]
MTAYVIAHLQDAAPHPEVAEYMERLPTTFEPYGGRYLVHVAQHEVKEGRWPGAVVMLGFPDLARARAWWDSPSTGRSRRCARGTSRATSSWSKASPRATTRPPPRRRYERPRVRRCPPSSARTRQAVTS